MTDDWKPTAEWLVAELAVDDPWAYSPEGERCFWCDRLRHSMTDAPSGQHAERCPWILAWKFMRKEL